MFLDGFLIPRMLRKKGSEFVAREVGVRATGPLLLLLLRDYRNDRFRSWDSARETLNLIEGWESTAAARRIASRYVSALYSFLKRTQNITVPSDILKPTSEQDDAKSFLSAACFVLGKTKHATKSNVRTTVSAQLPENLVI